MEDNLVIDDVINVYEGEFKPGYIKRNELRQCDGFCFYFAGNAEYIFENTTLSVRAGDVLFLPENAEYNIMVNTPCAYICIDFSFVKKGLKPCVIENAKNVKNDFYKFFYNWINNSPTKIPRSFELINRIYCQLINSRRTSRSKSDEIFAKAVELILQHYREPDFTVEALAKRLDITTVHLRRIFSHNTSISPIKYINDIRFEQAKTLLTSSNLTIGEIALSLGFTDQFHFSKSFKNIMGISPTEYRKNT